MQHNRCAVRFLDFLIFSQTVQIRFYTKARPHTCAKVRHFLQFLNGNASVALFNLAVSRFIYSDKVGYLNLFEVLSFSKIFYVVC